MAALLSQSPADHAGERLSGVVDVDGCPGPDSAGDAGDRPATSADTRGSLVPLLLLVHFYAGVFVAPFLVVAALTGLAFTVAPQLDRMVYAELLATPSTGPAQPLAAQVRSAQEAIPDDTLTGVRPPAAAGATTRVVFAQEGLTEDRQRTAYVDPVTNEVLGHHVTWFDSTPLTTWLDDLHRHLQLGAVGRYYSELAASWMWVLVLGGLSLWWSRQRTARRRARALLLPDLRAAKGVRRTRSWHATTGVSIALGLIFLSVTGLTWSNHAGARFSAALTALGATAPVLDTALPGAPEANNPAGGHDGHGGGDAPSSAPDPAPIDDVLAAGRAEGLEGPVEIATPAGPDVGWVVAEADNRWPVRLDQVAIDPSSGAVLDRVDFSDRPLLSQLTTLGVLAHMGILFGPLNQLLLAALAVGLLAVICWGYRMWWQRRPTRWDGRRPLGQPPSRGAWRSVPRWQLALAVPGVFAVAWTMPVLGWSLLGFLVVDAVWAVRTHRRAAG